MCWSWMLHLPSRYYKCLAAIETRFPISSEKGNVRINFPWTDAFRSSKKTSQANIHFEKAAVLFNVAAILSQQALQVMSAGFATVVPSVLPAAAIAIMLQQAALSFWVGPGAKFTLPWTFAGRNWLIPCLIHACRWSVPAVTASLKLAKSSRYQLSAC